MTATLPRADLIDWLTPWARPRPRRVLKAAFQAGATNYRSRARSTRLSTTLRIG
jgi:hypothetical protein